MSINITTALTTLFNKIVDLNNNKVDISAVNNICGAWETLTVTCTPGTGWTQNTCSAKLVGDRISVTLGMTRGTSISAGNITNEKVCTLVINTLGKINGGYITSFNTGGTGTNASFYLGNWSVSGSGSSQTLTTSVNISSTYSTGTSFNIIFSIYVRPDVSYYGI